LLSFSASTGVDGSDFPAALVWVLWDLKLGEQGNDNFCTMNQGLTAVLLLLNRFHFGILSGYPIEIAMLVRDGGELIGQHW